MKKKLKLKKYAKPKIKKIKLPAALSGEPSSPIIGTD